MTVNERNNPNPDSPAMCVRPLHCPIGFWLGPVAVAALSLREHQTAGTVPEDILPLVGKDFYERALRGELPGDHPEFVEQDWVVNRLTNHCIYNYNRLCQAKDFTGRVQSLWEHVPCGREQTYVRNRTALYIEASKQPTPFRQAYKDFDDAVWEFRSLLGDLLPDDFPYEEHVVEIDGLYVD